mgnify:CR=1 FL=1
MSSRTNIAIVAWDTEFIDKFSKFTLPCLLSSGNLPALARTHTIRLLFYTDRKSHDHFKNATAKMKNYGECIFHLFEDTEVDGETIKDTVTSLKGDTRKHEIDRRIQFHAIDKSLEAGERETLFLINQDLVISDGSLLYAQTKIDSDADAVLIPLLRLSLETAGELSDMLANSDHVGLNAESLIRKFPEILHPVSQSLFVEAPEFSTYPSAIFWPAKDHGWLGRSFFPYTLALKPRNDCRRFDSTIDYDYALTLAKDPKRAVIPSDSNQAFVAKVTTKSYLDTAETFGQISNNRLAHFILAETNKAHRDLANQPYRIYRNSGIKTDTSVWSMAEDLSSKYLDEIYHFIGTLKDKLPKDSAEMQEILSSHFGDLSGYLSPMRRTKLRRDSE